MSAAGGRSGPGPGRREPPDREPAAAPPAGGSRERILGRVRAALEERAPVEHPGSLSFPDPAGQPAVAFATRFRDAGGEVVELFDEAAARAWLREFARGFASVTVGRGLPDPLRPELPEALPHEAELGVSMAHRAAADTGSLLLDSREGRRSQLLPPTHLVWVRRDRIAATLAEALEAAAADGLPAAVGLHSGPSKSADIGQILVKGIHGPGRVVAAVVEALPVTG